VKVLTIAPQYVEQILDGVKTREFRSWSTRYRGMLLLHASLPTGAILGCVELVGIDGQAGDFAWLLRRPQTFKTPVRCKGRLGLWDLDPSLEAAVKAQLRGSTPRPAA
jgi:hypothetical protein